MSAQAVIDSLEFARAEQELQGSAPVGTLARLQDCLFDADGTIRYRLKGGHDKKKNPILAVEISGLLHLRCQRCLGPMQFELQLSNEFRLTARDGDVDSTIIDPMAPDWIEASAALDVVRLVEDEILLNLPMSPRHAEQDCKDDMSKAQRVADRPKPFAELAKLKKVVDNRN